MAFLEIGGTPCDEECAQTGVTRDAQEYNRLECRAYIEALRIKYGKEPEGAELRLKGSSHEFGTYYEVACHYDQNNEAARSYAFKVENGLATWEEAGFWKPVVYDRSQPVHVIRDPAAWSREANPTALPTLPAKV